MYISLMIKCLLLRLSGRLPENVAFHQLTVAIDLVLSNGRVNPEAVQIFSFQLNLADAELEIHISLGQSSLR